MDPDKDKEADAPTTATEAAPPTQPAQLPAPKASSPAPSTTSSTGRPPYMPQFSAATQMILKRINSKPGSLSSALSSASSTVTKTSIEKSTFEDAKRRLVMNMNTSLTMPMPTPKNSFSSYSPTTQKSSSASTLRMPMNDAFNLRTPAPAKALPTTKQATQSQKAQAQKPKGKTHRGTKRKRGKDDDDNDTSSSLSDLSGSEGDAATATATTAGATAKDTQAAPTMTKSGRQVQKPTQYNPSQQSARDAKRRAAYGKQRTPEQQALCKVCTRGLSLTANQIVFCDGCNCGWHQMCHEPYIDDDFVSDESRSWFCGRCLAKRERHLARKKNLDGFRGVSWAAKSNEQKRSYLSGVPHTQLVNIIMYSTELHPDLPIFPIHEPRRGGAQAARPSSSYDGTRIKADPNASANINVNVGPTNYSSKVSTPDTQLLNPKVRESSVESVPPAWPKVGHGCLAGLQMDEDDLRDDNDYEAFSVTTYDAKGRKVMENGMTV